MVFSEVERRQQQGLSRNNKVCLWMELLGKSHGELDWILCRKNILTNST